MSGPEALENVASIPRDNDGPVFPAPWAARAFAMAVAMHERGVFTWGEWSKTLGPHVAAATADDPGDAEAYWRAWLAALEDILGEKQVAARKRPRSAGSMARGGGAHAARSADRAAGESAAVERADEEHDAHQRDEEGGGELQSEHHLTGAPVVAAREPAGKTLRADGERGERRHRHRGAERHHEGGGDAGPEDPLRQREDQNDQRAGAGADADGEDGGGCA